ncbi:hypothetical protein HY572_03940 [Candidatus Micrarchaeota archaeon]|nr:hypothetical protein [Candidatus Micrarchaeota archaeon]
MLAEIVFLQYALGAAAWDVALGKVPNFWNGLWVAAGFSLAGLSFPVLAAGGFVLGLWRLGVWGAGDAKFFVGMALFCSAWLWPWAWLAVFLASAVLLAGWLVFNRQNSKGLRPSFVPFLVAGFVVVWALAGLGVLM